MRIILFLSLLLIVSCSSYSEQTKVEPDVKKTETNIQSNKEETFTPLDDDDLITERLPAEFTELSKEIIADLEKRKCKIPQWSLNKEKHNVIEGAFKKKGQKDAAVLCFDGSANSVLIYWNKATNKVSKIDERKGNDDRVIDVADAKYIYDHYEWYDGPKPPKITHQGINDIFPEKASMIHYLHNGKWLELQGAD